jgi:hypothetical protein
MPRLILGYERPRAVDDVNLEKTSRSEWLISWLIFG